MGRLATILERRNFLDLAQSVEDAPRSLTSIPTPDADLIIARAEIRGMEMVRRLGVDGKSSRLPAYIWMIIFG
jgi:hypothetical protein